MARRRLLLAGLIVLGVASVVVFTLGRSGVRAVVSQWIEWQFDDLEHRSASVLAQQLTGGDAPLLLDVRRRDEYLAGHIKGARWVAPDSPAASVLTPSTADRAIVAYCSVGWRSSRLVERLRAAGHTDVSNLAGGLFEWTERGYPVMRAGRVTTRVHGYGRPWAWLLPDAQRVRP